MHSLLKRQLAKFLPEAGMIPEALRPFIEAINRAYEESDNDRKMLERSMELSSQEMMQSNAEMRALQGQLESRVQERIADLFELNKSLQAEITYRKHTEAENMRRVSELEALYENGLAISQLVEPHKIAHKMVEILSKKLNWHHAAIRLYHPHDDRMELLALGQPGLSEAEIEINIQRLNQMLGSVDRGVSGWVIRNRETVRSGNLADDPRYIESYSGMQSGLYVPLLIGNDILGSIAVESEETNAFSEQDERLLVTLASQAAIAIQNAQFYLQTQRELEERKRAEEQNRRQTIALEAAANAIVITDRDGTIQWINSAWSTLTGYSSTEAVGKNTRILKSGKQDQAFYRDLWETILAGGMWHGELVNKRKDGSLYTEEETITPVKDEQGQITHFISIKQDVTGRKEAEEERRRLIHDLGERVKELTVLHNASRIFMDQPRSEQQVLEELISILPSAWQYPEITAARITFDSQEYSTASFKKTPWMLRQSFVLPNNHECLIEIAYLEEKPPEDEGPFSKEERYLLESMAEKLQSFLTAKLAETSIQRHNVEMSLMLEVGRELSNTVDLKEIYSIVYRYISRWVPCDHLVISSYNPVDQLIRCEYLYNTEGEQDVSGFPLIPLEPEGQGTQSMVIRNGKSLLLPDYIAQLARTSTAYNFNDQGEIVEDLPQETERTRSAILVPFIVQGQVNGVMQVFHHSLQAHSQDHLHFVESLAFRVSGALVNAKLFHQLQIELLQRRLVEDEIRHLNTELEQRVEERTAEIESTGQRLEIAANAGGIAVWEINLKSNQVFWDKRMYAIHGMTADNVELSIELWWSLLHPDDLAKAQSAYQVSLKESGRLIDEHRIVLPDGSIRHVTANGIVTYDMHGLPERMVGVNIDVTQQRQAEQALHESETYARLLFDAAPDPVFVEEVDGVMVDVNNLFEQQHQVKRENVRGKHISKLGIFPAEEIDKAREYVSAIMQNGNIPPVELDFYAPDNEIHTLEMHSYPIEVGGKHLVLSTSRDITVHKKAEETLRLANAEMERALRIKDEFLASMSHELRTPLNAILGISESLEEQIIGPLNEKQMKYLRTINESGHHLHELINDILDLSKIEAGRLELNILDVHAEHLCQASLRMIKELAQKKGLNLMVSIDPQVHTLKGDERRLKQALVNLLSNAVKFTPSGKEIGLELKGHPETSEVTFTVWDYGIGIAAQDMGSLFKPFVQLDSSLSREYAGTGLGLALVAQMVRLHGGNVGVESKLGQGSRFTITLPWTPEEQSARGRIIAQNAQTGRTSARQRNSTVLIVEDTDTVITLVSEYLQHKGYKVLMANNGMEGVRLAKKKHPDLILMDVMMPVMDGLEAARQIRADEILNDVPIIALTALAMPGDRERCLAAGMNDYLSKPIEFKELMEVMDRHLPPANSEEK